MSCANSVPTVKSEAAGCNADLHEYINAVVRAFHRAQISPARIDHRRVTSNIRFLVRFTRSGMHENIDINPNFGINADLYGEDYSSAQYCRSSPGSNRCFNKVSVVLFMVVTEKGTPEKLRVLNKDMPDYCSRYFISLVRRRRFIPAFHDGIPVRSRRLSFLNVDRQGITCLSTFRDWQYSILNWMLIDGVRILNCAI